MHVPAQVIRQPDGIFKYSSLLQAHRACQRCKHTSCSHYACPHASATCIPSVAPERLRHVEPPLVESQRRNDDCCRIAGWLDGRDAQRTTPRATVAVLQFLALATELHVVSQWFVVSRQPPIGKVAECG